MSVRPGGDPGVMMQLGTYQFSITTSAYQSLNRTTEYRWAAQERFGQLAALQNTGPGADTITLEGYILPVYRGGFEQVNNMRAVAGRQVPLLLISGVGSVLGQFVIESIDEAQGTFAQAGAPRRQDFTVKLRKYAEASAISGGVVPAVTGLSAGALLSGKLSPESLTAAVSRQVANVVATANTISTIADAVGLSGSVGLVADSVASATQGAFDAIKGSAAGTLLLQGVPELKGMVATAKSVRSAAKNIQAAGSDPLAIAEAVAGLSSVAGKAASSLGGTAAAVLAKAGFANGASSTTLFAQQATAAARSVQTLATDLSSIKGVTKKALGVLGYV